MTEDSVASSLRGAAAAGIDSTFTLFDDGSTDGTAEVIRAHFPDLHLLKGNGHTYWARSMAEAETSALAQIDVEDDQWLVWLNDDVDLDDDALIRLAQAMARFPNSVIVGSMRDPESGQLTYGGLIHSGHHPLRFSLVQPLENDFVRVDTFNGNLVAVPVQIARRLGGIDGRFSHALADIDYGLRCQRLGIEALLAPGYFGNCARNVPATPQSLINEWKRFTGVKGGGHPSSLRRFLGRHSRIGPVWVGLTYATWWGRSIARAGSQRVR